MGTVSSSSLSSTVAISSPSNCGRFLILADDLTGAADTAAALAGPGEEAEVFLEPDLAGDASGRIVAVDLNTRSLPVGAAAAAVGYATAALSRNGIHLFKKIDSTLRGHIGAELAALCRNLRSDAGAIGAAGEMPTLCIVAPAHPELGRTLENGQLRVHGVAAAATTLWGDCADNHGNSLTAELQAHGFECTPLSLPVIRSLDKNALSRVMDQAAGNGFQTMVCDAQSMDDMRRIAAAALDMRACCVWVGSGGLAQALADVLEPATVTVAEPEALETGALSAPAPGSRVFVVGSFSSVAREQVSQLIQTGHVSRVALTVEELTDSPRPDNLCSIDEILAAGQDLVICIDAGEAIRPELSGAIARGMAELIANRLERLSVLVCCGGDTSRALFDLIRVGQLRVRRSAEPGSTHALTGLQPQLPLILKAGAFGDARLLVRLRQLLTTPRIHLA